MQTYAYIHKLRCLHICSHLHIKCKHSNKHSDLIVVAITIIISIDHGDAVMKQNHPKYCL